MLGKPLSVLVALLLLTGNVAMPVVCIASTHTEVEMPFDGCCAHLSAPARHAGVSLETSASGCGDCTDVPLISAAAPHSTTGAAVEQGVNVITDAPPAFFADSGDSQDADAPLLPPRPAGHPVSLRC